MKWRIRILISHPLYIIETIGEKNGKRVRVDNPLGTSRGFSATHVTSLIDSLCEKNKSRRKMHRKYIVPSFETQKKREREREEDKIPLFFKDRQFNIDYSESLLRFENTHTYSAPNGEMFLCFLIYIYCQYF